MGGYRLKKFRVNASIFRKRALPTIQIIGCDFEVESKLPKWMWYIVAYWIWLWKCRKVVHMNIVLKDGKTESIVGHSVMICLPRFNLQEA